MNANHEKISRRRFLGALAAGSAGIAAMPHFLSAAKTVKLSAIDQVPLGKSGIKFSRLGFGTGSMGGRVQRELGQAKFTALVRHALDRGITYFDTADNYRGMHEMLREALKGVDREKIQIQCKIWPGRHEETLKEIDRFR